MNYDAILVTSFGGPEGPDDVMPFLENVLRGKNVPRERMLQVAAHYYHFGGKSPINDQIRLLITALKDELAEHGPRLPIYWGNRNWHPMLADTLCQMKADGLGRALAFVTSAYSSYSSCRQYREDIARAQAAVGDGAPVVDKIRAFHNHPGFVEAVVDRIRHALVKIPESRRERAQLIYTAHSIPLAMAQGCDYEKQLRETGRLVAEELGREQWRLVYQSRSGPPSQPKAASMKHAALYLRVSTLDQHPETQLYDLRQLAQQRGYEIVQEYTDKISGAKAKRPGLDQLMADARHGRFQVVIVWVFDRLARSVRHFLEVLDELNHIKVEFVSFRENIDTSGPLGRGMVVIVSAIAELERNLIIERVRAGMRRAKLEGRHIGRRPLDVDRGAVIRDRRAGRSLSEIGRTHRISRALVSKILREAAGSGGHKGVSPAPLQLQPNKLPETAA